jgi:hypothetical protein
MVGEFQQSKAGSQRSVDCSRECCGREGAGLCILKQLLQLLFDGPGGAVGTQHVPHSLSGRRAWRLPRLSRIVFVVYLHQLPKCDTVYTQAHT